jgi:hypothetical protein
MHAEKATVVNSSASGFSLEPDERQIKAFVDAILRHGNSLSGFISIRSFYDRGEKKQGVARISLVQMISGRGFDFLVEVAVDDARRAAQDPGKVVLPRRWRCSQRRIAREKMR